MKKTMELLMFHGDFIFPKKFTLRCLGEGGATHPDGHGAAVGCRLRRNQNLILAKVMAEIMGEQIIIVVDSG